MRMTEDHSRRNNNQVICGRLHDGDVYYVECKAVSLPHQREQRVRYKIELGMASSACGSDASLQYKIHQLVGLNMRQCSSIQEELRRIVGIRGRLCADTVSARGIRAKPVCSPPPRNCSSRPSIQYGCQDFARTAADVSCTGVLVKVLTARIRRDRQDHNERTADKKVTTSPYDRKMPRTNLTGWERLMSAVLWVHSPIRGQFCR